MRCPHCGFKHLELREHCIRCRKPLRADDGSFPESSDSSIEIRSLTSPVYQEPAEDSAEFTGSLSIEQTMDGEESLLGACSDSRSMELMLEREDEAEEKPGEGSGEYPGEAAGEEDLEYTFGDSGSAAAEEETGEPPDEASGLAPAEDDISVAEPEAFEEAAASAAEIEPALPESLDSEPEVELEVMAEGSDQAQENDYTDESDFTEPEPPEALAPGEESDTTECLEASGGVEQEAGEDTASPEEDESLPGDDEAGLSEDSASVPLDDEEGEESAAFPDADAEALLETPLEAEPDEARFEQEVVAALAGEITDGSQESEPAPEQPAEEASASGAEDFADDGALADDGAIEDDDEESEVTAELDPLSVPGDDTARAVLAIMDAEAVPEDLPFDESLIETEAAESGADSMSAGTDSTAVGTEERRLDAFFNRAEDSAAPAADEDSKIEIGAPAKEAPPPEPLCLPLGDDSTGGGSSSTGRRVRSVRVTRPRRTRDRTAMFLTIRRAAAGGFDLLVWIGLGWLLFWLARTVTGMESLHGTALEWAYLVLLPLTLITAVLAMIYGGLFGSLTGKTPGMMIFGLRLMGPDGGSPRPALAFVRTGVFLLSILPLGAGLILMLPGGDKGGLHDRLSGLRVERI